MPGKITEETTISLEEYKIRGVSDLAENIQKIISGTTADILKTILAGAIILNASDIHLEPEKERTKIRVRIDGVLHDVIFVPQKVYSALLSRIKLLSGLKLNITDRPQDGRFSVWVPKTALSIEIRTSVVPAEHGESLAARILNPQNLISLENLGLREDLLSLFKKEIKKPNGMIIVTGPTGSGKTTTLYAFLKTIQNPEIKIITIEDPIEYHLEGIEQTQVSKNYDFANGLQAIVRQDPDVILVGEIRDAKTADIALQAALTGHLVFATLHTNDATGTISRLVALGAKPYNIGPAINIAVAQRLIRKVCQNCSSMVQAKPEEIQKLQKELDNLPPKIKIPALKTGLKIPKIKMCKECNDTGYRDRIGIFEAFVVDSEIEDLISTTSSVSQLRNLAIKKGMVTIRQDGFIKVLQGITTVEEIERVTAERD